jgi:hypothetical protein
MVPVWTVHIVMHAISKGTPKQLARQAIRDTCCLYYGAANMSGKYSGRKTKIRDSVHQQTVSRALRIPVSIQVCVSY